MYVFTNEYVCRLFNFFNLEYLHQAYNSLSKR